MPGPPFPTEEIAAEVTAVLDAVDLLGHFHTETEIVVLLPHGAGVDGLPDSAAGYPVRYRESEWTATGLKLTQDEVIRVGQGAGNRFALGYDAELDKISVHGYFADPAVARRVAAIPAVALDLMPRYELTDAEWQAQNEAFAASVPALLAEWADFPYERTPRPLIVLDIPVRGPVDSVPHRGGPPAVIAETDVPDPVLAQLTRHGAPPDMPPLRVVDARHTAGWFFTDRGQVELPAWELTFADGRGACTALDPETPIWWPRTDEQWRLTARRMTARIEADDVTVHVSAAGGDLTEFLTVTVHESDTAVLAAPITREGAGTSRAVGINRPMTTVLAHPLGRRVLIDGRGVPYVVVPEGTSLRPRWWPDDR